jgi:hypothetical protein
MAPILIWTAAMSCDLRLANGVAFQRTDFRRLSLALGTGFQRLADWRSAMIAGIKTFAMEVSHIFGDIGLNGRRFIALSTKNSCVKKIAT